MTMLNFGITLTFINKLSGNKIYALSGDAREGTDAYYIKSTNISLPKTYWRVER